MTRHVYRYTVLVDGEPHRLVLTSGPLAAAATTAGSLIAVEFWAENDDGAPEAARLFQVFGTGHPLPPGAKWRATCPRTPEGLVWHLYEVTP